MRVAFTYHPFNIPWNHGAAVLSALCQEAGIETEMFPLYDGFTGAGFDYVCLSFVTVHDYLASVPFLAHITQPKLAGGVYSRKGGYISGCDHVCRGEGERLVDFFLRGDTAVFDSQLLDTNINILPDMSAITGYEFGRGIPFLAGKKLIPYSHSRGCPYKCSFCEVRNLPQQVRVKTSIKRDLEILGGMVPDMFYFTDETIPYYMRSWREQIKDNKTPFLSFLRADIQPAHLDFLIDNGLQACAIGVESGNEKYRNTVLKKGVTDAQIYRTLDRLDRSGVDRLTLFMRNTPQETDEMRYETFDMIDKIGGHSVIFEYEAL